MPTTVTTIKRFRQYGYLSERSIERALGHSAAVGVAAARAKETRVKTGDLRRSIRVTRVETRRGRSVKTWLHASDHKAIWHELGTLQRRRRKLKKATLARQATPSGAARLARATGGVRPLYFLQAGKRAAAAALLPNLRREWPK